MQVLTMSYERKMVLVKNKLVPIQFTGNHQRIPEENWLQVPEYKEEKQFIYIWNDWKG